MKELSEARKLFIERQRKRMEKMWKQRRFREAMVEKQKQLGYRTYGDGIYYSRNKSL